MKLDTTWVEVFNRNVLPHSTLVRENREVFKFKGMFEGNAIFEYVLVHRDAQIKVFDTVKELVEAYRANINQLADLKSARVYVKPLENDTYYTYSDVSGHDYLWTYSLSFEEPAPRCSSIEKADVADLDFFWMLNAGKFFVMHSQSQIHLKDFDDRLGVMVIEAVVSSSLVDRKGGFKAVAQETYGNMMHVLSGYLAANFIEYHIREKNGNTQQVFAGYAGEELYLVEECRVD